jgi:hypothetical protein
MGRSCLPFLFTINRMILSSRETLLFTASLKCVSNSASSSDITFLASSIGQLCCNILWISAISVRQNSLFGNYGGFAGISTCEKNVKITLHRLQKRTFGALFSGLTAFKIVLI